MRSRGRALLIVLIVLLLLGFAGVVIGLLLVGRGKSIPGETILELDLTQPIAEYVPGDVFTRSLIDHRLDLREVVRALEEAAQDDGVVALLARLGSVPMGLAQIQEIRTAIEAFSTSGKKTVAYADTFGEWGPGNGSYYLATAFDEIYLQPSGDIGLTGLLYQTSFLRGTLEKLGIEPRMDHRSEYKNAMNSLTETEYTEPHEEAMQVLVDSQFEQISAGVTSGRGLGIERAVDLFDRGPYLGQEAVDAGLVDGLAYRDEVYQKLRDEFGEEGPFVGLSTYAGGVELLGKGETVALIYGVGAVMRGESDYDPFTGDQVMGSETVSKAFRDAVDDPRVKAILFRVDSPGGSYVASDSIWRETVRAREAGKPVVVSMGNIAGSGGYFVAMAADAIIAQPGTITGSIGVYGGKLLNRNLWDKLGISFDDVATSANSRMWSSLDDYTEQGFERFQDSLDRIYDDFTAKVAEGRDLPLETVREIAKGRIWTGAMAKELGLVDEVGGYPAAMAKIREALDLDEDAGIRFKIFPRAKSAFEFFVDRFPGAGSTSPEGIDEALRVTRALTRALRTAGLLEPHYGPLSMPANAAVLLDELPASVLARR
ncbi:MAG: signal peptide peptidase SppA [Acidobacteriota bacterium]|nr:signal peptide peptidase SppA [Acidobacteriota bacterium]